MKKGLIYMVTMLITISSFSQKGTSVSKNEIVYKGKVIVLLENGEKVEGTTNYSRMFDTNLRVKIEGVKKARKLKIKEVREFTINDTIVFIKVKSTIGTKYARPLVSKNNKLKVYDVTYQSSVSAGRGSNKNGLLFPTFQEYWVFLPGKTKAIPVKDISLTRKKVAKSIADCDELSKKVLNKEKGYRLPMLYTVVELVEVYKKISEEYEACN